MKWKEIYRTRHLRKALERQNRSIHVPAPDEIKRVGVLWQPGQKEAMNFLREHFNKKQIIFRSFCVYDELSSPLEANNALTRADLNWWGIPKEENIKEFLSLPFDVLFMVSLAPNYALDYLCALSPASFKVGGGTTESPYCDLNIKLDENQDALFLVKQQIFYLAALNKM